MRSGYKVYWGFRVQYDSEDPEDAEDLFAVEAAKLLVDDTNCVLVYEVSRILAKAKEVLADQWEETKEVRLSVKVGGQPRDAHQDPS